MSLPKRGSDFLMGLALGARIIMVVVLALYGGFLLVAQLNGGPTGWVMVAADLALLAFVIMQPWRSTRLSPAWQWRVMVLGSVVLVVFNLVATWAWLKV